jgi:serine protease Do
MVVQGNAGAESSDNRLTINQGPAQADALSLAFAKVAEQVEPSVVNITVRQGDRRLGAREGTGSGVIVNTSGFIITNHHVVRRAADITVKLATGVEHQARVIGTDEETDLAVIKIDAPAPLPVTRMGNSDRLKVGDWVLAIGSPFGLEQTVTAGIISAKDRIAEDDSSPFQQFLQTDAAINPGNSGGPLVNLSGEVVGINTQIATLSGVFNGIGFALPSSTAVEAYNQLVTQGRIRRGFLGVELMGPGDAGFNPKEQTGVMVKGLTGQAAPAARAGLQRGDVIISINGQKISDNRQLIRFVASLPVGSDATITYLRDGKQRTAMLKLEERPRESSAEILESPGSRTPDPRGEAGEALGLTVHTLTDESASRGGFVGTLGALVSAVAPGSPAGRHGIKVNDVIIDVNRRPILTREDFLRVCRNLKSGDEVVIKLLRKQPGGDRRRSGSVVVTFKAP